MSNRRAGARISAMDPALWAPAAADRHSPERLLWLAVIERALRDGCGLDLWMLDNKFGLRDLVIGEGRGFFETGPARRGFRDICDAAGLDPAGVQRAALARFAAEDGAPPPERARPAFAALPDRAGGEERATAGGARFAVARETETEGAEA